MSFKSRRRRDGWLQRVRGLFKEARPHSTEMLSDDQFRLAIAKERARAERRDLTFCVIRFDPANRVAPSQATTDAVASAFRQRLRITDEIGDYQGSLGVLLPETIPSQAALVANDLTEIAGGHSLPLNSDIFAWPVPDDGGPPNRGGDSGSYDVVVDPAEKQVVDGPPDTQQQNGTVALANQPEVQAESQLPSFKIRPFNFSAPTPWWKRSFDIAASLGGLLLLSPVIVGTALAIKATSRGPVFFWQWREGKNGQLFQICKFRTMRTGAEEEQVRFRDSSEQDGPAFKIKDDPRLTSIGRYLRKSCIDELPQLFNVLRGEMSLVGPRPLPADESLDCSPWQRRRLDVLPGMTCIWQVSGGRDIPFDEWMRMDLDYIRDRSLWADTVLLFRTLMVTLMHRGSV